MALIEGDIIAAAGPAKTVIEFLFAGWPPLVLSPLPAPTTTDLDDPYPLLDSIDPLDLVSADSRGNPGDLLGPPNRVAIFGEQRSDTLKNYTNSMIRLANLLTDNFLDRDGEQTGLLIAETTYMLAALDLGGFKLINMAPGILAKDLVNFDQFKDVQFSFDDQDDISNQSILRRDGTNVMASQFDLGVSTPGRRLVNLGVPSQPQHAVTKTYSDTQLDNFETDNLLRTGAAPMLGDWDLGVQGIQFLQDPTVDSDAVSKSFFDALAISTGIGGVPIGAVMPYYGSVIQANFLLCDGREVARADHPLLFSVIGVGYGTPSTGLVFKLPDLRGRVVIAMDSQGGVLAGRVTAAFGLTLGGGGGEEDHTLVVSEFPAHTHAVADDNFMASGAAGALTGVTTPVTDAVTLTTTADPVDSIGGDGSHANMQPSIACVYVIRTDSPSP